MSAPQKDPGDLKRPPGSPAGGPQSPNAKRLRDRVSFFEKVWTGDRASRLEDSSDTVDVEELESKLAEERARHVGPSQLEQVTLRHTQSLGEAPDESFQETVIKTVEEGDLASGVKTVKFEKVTVKKTVRQITSSSTTSASHKITSRTPSDEQILDDSAYQTHSNGNLTTHSNSSSVSSLTGRFPSDENLRRTPSRELLKDDWTKDDCDSVSGSSKVTNSSSEWYSEYRSQSFQNTSKLEYVRSKSQYDHHIAVIRGQNLISYI